MKKEIKIKAKKMEIEILKEYGDYRIHISLLGVSYKYDYITFDKDDNCWSKLKLSTCYLLDIKHEDYDTLDKAIALWGLEDPRKPKTVQDLKNGDRYWIVGNSGYLLDILWYNHTCDIKRRKAGNCFLSEKDGLKKIEKDEAKVSLLKIISDYNNGWTPDWSDSDQIKWFYTFYPDKGGYDVAWTSSRRILENEFYIKDGNIPLTDEVIKLLNVIYDYKS